MILVIGASEMQLPLIRRARKLGRTLVFDMNLGAPGCKIADEVECVSTQDYHGAVRAAAKWAKKERIDAVVTCGTDCSMTVAAVALHHECRSHDFDTAEVLTRKSMMAERLRRWMPCIPPFSRGPYVVKPDDNMGGRGVTLLAVDVDREPARASARLQSPTGKIVWQMYTKPVAELSNIYFVQDRVIYLLSSAERLVKVVPKKSLGEGNFGFVEVGHRIPPRVARDVLEDCDMLCREVIMELGIEWGPVKFDLAHDGKRAWMLEACARFPGHYHTSNAGLHTGVDILDAYLLSALGKLVKWPKIDPWSPGVMQVREGEVRAKTWEHPDAVRINDNLNARNEPECSAERGGFLVVSAPHGIDIEARFERVKREVEA